MRQKGKNFCSGTVKVSPLLQKCLFRFGESVQQRFAIIIASCFQLAKRAFVRALLIFAAQYQVLVPVSRDSADSIVLAARGRLFRRVRPDKGGRHEDIRIINAAGGKWNEARSQKKKVEHGCFPTFFAFGFLQRPFIEVTDFTVPLQ